jgi:hypothetical protein
MPGTRQGKFGWLGCPRFLLDQMGVSEKRGYPGKTTFEWRKLRS